MSTHRHVARSAGNIGILTAVSRGLGFVRDMVIASAFGTGVAAEAFVVSFRIPNLLRDMVGEGAANAAFVPVLTECREKKKEEFWGLVSALFLSMASVLIVLTALGILLAPQIVSLIAPGFKVSGNPEKFPLAVKLTRAIFPYIFLIGLSSLAMAILNSLKEFTSSAIGPILLNVSMIAAGLAFEPLYGPLALVWGVLAGGALQLGCQLPALFKKGFFFAAPSWGHGSLWEIGRLLVPRALGSGLYQINVLVGSILASFETWVGVGGQSALYYSNRLFQLPLAIFGISLAQALLPTFSTQSAGGDTEGLKRTLSLSLRTLTAAVLPASAGLAVFSEPIIRTLFQRGRFDGASTQITAAALFFYSFGLLSCCLIKILANAFYAMHDTRTPLKAMGVSVALNVSLSLILMRPLGIGGLTLASSVSATANLFILYLAFRKKVGLPDERGILVSFGKALGASCLMGFFAAGYQLWVLNPLRSASAVSQALCLAVGIVLGILVYAACAAAFRMEEMQAFKKVFSR